MSDFTTPDEEQEFAQYVDALEAEGEQVMAEADRVDQQAQKQAQAKKAEHEDSGVVTKTEYMADKFLASASEEEARLFAIYRRGDEDPRQLKGIIELAQTKAAEAARAIGEEVEVKAEEKATKIASDQYGVGPLANGVPSPPVDDWEAGRERIRQGDMHTAFQMFNSLPSTGGVTQPD